MTSLTFFKFLGIIGAIGTTIAVPTGIFLHTSNGGLKDVVISREELKVNCYTILSDDFNKKELIVCKNQESLRYYVVDKKAEQETISEIRGIVTSSGANILGGNVIVELKWNGKKESLSGIKNKDDVLSTLNSLGQEGLYSKCKKIEQQGADSFNLSCENNKSIPLTKYQ